MPISLRRQCSPVQPANLSTNGHRGRAVHDLHRSGQDRFRELEQTAGLRHSRGDFTGLVLDYAESHAILNVCRLKKLGILDATKGVNVNATVNYDSDGDGVLKQIDTMCRDDPAAVRRPFIEPVRRHGCTTAIEFEPGL